MQKKQKQLSNYTVWFDGTNINEAAFCEEFLRTHKILFANNAFFTPEGRITDDLPLRGDKHGWILGYTVHPGNDHDSRTFKALYDRLYKLNMRMVVADAGDKTPAIAHQLLEDGIELLFSYICPKIKDGFFRKHEFVYDEYYDCYICPTCTDIQYNKQKWV